jgi:hypothetical protein
MISAMRYLSNTTQITTMGLRFRPKDAHATSLDSLSDEAQCEALIDQQASTQTQSDGRTFYALSIEEIK